MLGAKCLIVHLRANINRFQSVRPALLEGSGYPTITITIQDTEDGQVSVTESRLPGDGEIEEAVTSATALADAMFEVMDQLGGKLRGPFDNNSMAHLCHLADRVVPKDYSIRIVCASTTMSVRIGES